MITAMIDSAQLAMFDVIQARQLEDFEGSLRISERVAKSTLIYNYQLQSRVPLSASFARPIFSLATRSAGAIVATYADSSFATNLSINGDEGDLFCFTSIIVGQMTLAERGHCATAVGGQGLAWRPGPGSQLLISDDNARSNVFLKVSDVEDGLVRMLDEPLRQPLEFAPSVDWSSGLAASLKRQFDFVLGDFRAEDGVVSSPIALASLTDLLVSLVLRGTSHNYSNRLTKGSSGAVPAYVRRAEDFMRRSAADPIRMAHVAAAAGCSQRTLDDAFKQFRGSTPLGALHAIRLELARDELTLGAPGSSVTTVARRYGFTNSSRFAKAFRLRFGQTPVEVALRASRSLRQEV